MTLNFKIALKNVKKSYKDYTIYFLTLTLAVSLFYTFNSVESQRVMFDTNSYFHEIITFMTFAMAVVSAWVALLLGGLILYANNFLIKRRKKELGLYCMLGMSKKSISKILILETVFVGLMSLLSGLILGVLLSQGLSILTINLFEANMSEYVFIFSFAALLQTIGYFVVIFIGVMIFNTVLLSRYKIIDLLTAHKKNEKMVIKHPLLYLVIFMINLVMLLIAYKLGLELGLDPNNPLFKIAVALGFISTFGIFYSLTGFLLFIFKRIKPLYFKDLNIFIVKQINSKMNTNFASLSVICLMLFFTIGVLSTGFSYKKTIESGLVDTTPFDASANMYISEEDNIQSVEEGLKAYGFEFGDESYISMMLYEHQTSLMDLVDETFLTDNQYSDLSYSHVSFLSESDYNKFLNFQGEEVITLASHEVLILSNVPDILNLMKDYQQDFNAVSIAGHSYSIQNEKPLEKQLQTKGYPSTYLTVVVQDELVSAMSPYWSILNVNYGANALQSEARLGKVFNDFNNGLVDFAKAGFVNGDTRTQIFEETKGMSTTILFIAIYLGIVFLIASTAILAIGQLSEASDSYDRYTTLRRIGASEKMINRSIFTQVALYFGLPLGLALIHSIVGIQIVNDFISMYNKPDITGASLFTLCIFVVIYGGYFLATYLGYKNIVRST